jgi:hypothetical protein
VKRLMKLALAAAVACLCPTVAAAGAFSSPEAVRWNASVEEMQAGLGSRCTAGQELRTFDPPQIPGASEHKQIDCRGFEFRGKPRVLEFVFADNQLQAVWIIMDAAEAGEVVAAMRESFGEPDAQYGTVVAFTRSRALWRGDKSEVLIYGPDMSELMKLLVSRQGLPN